MIEATGLRPPPEPELNPEPEVKPWGVHWAPPAVVAVLVVVAWWPVGAFWQSDDWIAVHYASQPGRALSDFAGNYFGLDGLAYFYRPFITLTWIIDAAVGGADPFAAHLSNAVAHGLAAGAVCMLATRFVGAVGGCCAGLVWGLSPVHAGAVMWAAGRTGTWATLWIVLAAVFLVRWIDCLQKRRWPALVFFALALCTKELAVAAPGIALILCFALSRSADGGLARRVGLTLKGVWPFFVVFAAYLGLRWVLFGRLIGGYSGGALDPVAMAQGLGTWTLRELNPMTVLTADGLAFGDVWTAPEAILSWRHAGFVPAAGALVILLVKRRFGLLIGLAAAYAACVVPSWQFWSHTDDPKNLRYFALPLVAVAMLLGGGGIVVSALTIVCAVLPSLEIRTDYERSWEETQRIHALVREQAGELDPGPVFVSGLPRENAKHNVLAFHHGVDRILQPPFGEGRHLVYALRPVSGVAGAFTVPFGEQWGVPGGQTLLVERSTGAGRLRPASRPRVDVSIEGGDHLTSELLMAINHKRASPAFVIGGPRASHYRITLFSAGGYLTAVLPNEKPAGEQGGLVSLGAWLQARTGRGDYFVLEDMYVPTVVDLETRFPLLVEAGSAVEAAPGVPGLFEATHYGRELVWLRFDRDYWEFMTSGR